MLNTVEAFDVAASDDVVTNSIFIEPAKSPKPRILVADDHVLIAETLSMLLSPHFEVVGAVTDGNLIAAEVARLKPDVVLLDVAMPGLSGLDAARAILKLGLGTKVVFLTMHANRMIRKEAMEIGASGFLVKNCAASDLILAVKTVLSGGTYVSPGVKDATEAPETRELSQRQVAVLRLIARGFAAKQVGFELNISSRTAEFHKNAIMQKLNIRSTAQLTRYAIDKGLTS